MEIEKFELHGGSQDGRVFEFVNPFRPLTFSMDGHERYCLRPDNQSFGLVAPDAELVIHKDEKDVRFGTLEVPDDGKIVPGDVFSDGGKAISTEDYIGELRIEIARLKESNASLRAALDAHQNDPVCGDHAETWYCERPTVTFTPTEDAPQGCFLCEIASLKADLARVRRQRDRVAHLVRNMWRGSDLCANSEMRANVDLKQIGLRIENGEVKEAKG